MGLATVGLAVVGATALAPAVAAQAPPPDCEDDPYGCPPPPPDPEFTPTIQIRPPSGPAGRKVGVEACGYDPADDGQQGSITFNGSVVLAVTLDDDGCLVPGAGSNGLSNSFTVPNLPPGGYQVCSVFAGYSTPCTTFTITSGGGGSSAESGVAGTETERAAFAVQGVGIERSSPGAGALARTGASIVALLAIAFVLILGGRVLTLQRRDTRGQRTAR